MICWDGDKDTLFIAELITQLLSHSLIDMGRKNPPLQMVIDISFIF